MFAFFSLLLHVFFFYMRQPFHCFGLKGERTPLQVPKLDNGCFVLRALVLYTVGQSKHDIKLLFFIRYLHVLVNNQVLPKKWTFSLSLRVATLVWWGRSKWKYPKWKALPSETSGARVSPTWRQTDQTETEICYINQLQQKPRTFAHLPLGGVSSMLLISQKPTGKMEGEVLW